jgi:DNA repair protein RadC
MSHRLRRATQLTSPQRRRSVFLSLKLESFEREVFTVIILDERHRVVGYSEMTRHIGANGEMRRTMVQPIHEHLA